MSDPEGAQRIADGMEQEARARRAARYVEAAKHTAILLRGLPLWHPRREELDAHLDDQIAAIARGAGITPNQALELVAGPETAMLARVAERTGRNVLQRLGYQLPEEAGQ